MPRLLDRWWWYWRWRALRDGVVYRVQRATRGYSDDEVWSLNHAAVCYILPRLRALRGLPPTGHPADTTYEGWLDELDAMIAAFELAEAEEDWLLAPPDPLADARRHWTMEHGFYLFGRRLLHLWD